MSSRATRAHVCLSFTVFLLNVTVRLNQVFSSLWHVSITIMFCVHLQFPVCFFYSTYNGYSVSILATLQIKETVTSVTNTTQETARLNSGGIMPE